MSHLATIFKYAKEAAINGLPAQPLEVTEREWFQLCEELDLVHALSMTPAQWYCPEHTLAVICGVEIVRIKKPTA